MRFGAHVPTRGRLARAIDYAEAIGADALQIFVSNPRSWTAPAVRHDAAREFVERREASTISRVFVHSTYLVNVASPDDGFWRRSLDLARRELEAAAEIGADGLVVHAGAGGAGERAAAVVRAADGVRTVAGNDGLTVLLELTAGGAGTVASTIPQAVELLAAVDHDRVGLCLDTCHLFAAGYALDDPDRAEGALEELRSEALDARLSLVHANDSRDPRGSRRDRHDHPGAGRIGEHGLRAFLAHPALAECSVLVETPGTEEEHRRDVAALRALAGVPPRSAG
jgi:deoxyribonuclease IV